MVKMGISKSYKLIQRNLSKTAGHLWAGHNWPLQRGGCSTEVDGNALVLFGVREAAWLF